MRYLFLLWRKCSGIEPHAIFHVATTMDGDMSAVPPRCCRQSTNVVIQWLAQFYPYPPRNKFSRQFLLTGLLIMIMGRLFSCAFPSRRSIPSELNATTESYRKGRVLCCPRRKGGAFQ